MKLIKSILVIFVILLVLAKIGWLKPEIAMDVLNLGSKVKEVASTIDPIKVGELAEGILKDVSKFAQNVTFKDGKVLVKDKDLDMVVDFSSETVVAAKFARSNKEAALAVNSTLKKITGIDYDLMSLSNGNDIIEVELLKVSGEYKIKIN